MKKLLITFTFLMCSHRVFSADVYSVTAAIYEGANKIAEPSFAIENGTSTTVQDGSKFKMEMSLNSVKENIVEVGTHLVVGEKEISPNLLLSVGDPSSVASKGLKIEMHVSKIQN